MADNNASSSAAGTGAEAEATPSSAASAAAASSSSAAAEAEAKSSSSGAASAAASSSAAEASVALDSDDESVGARDARIMQEEFERLDAESDDEAAAAEVAVEHAHAAPSPAYKVGTVPVAPAVPVPLERCTACASLTVTPQPQWSVDCDIGVPHEYINGLRYFPVDTWSTPSAEHVQADRTARERVITLVGQAQRDVRRRMHADRSLVQPTDARLSLNNVLALMHARTHARCRRGSDMIAASTSLMEYAMLESSLLCIQFCEAVWGRLHPLKEQQFIQRLVQVTGYAPLMEDALVDPPAHDDCRFLFAERQLVYWINTWLAYMTHTASMRLEMERRVECYFDKIAALCLELQQRDGSSREHHVVRYYTGPGAPEWTEECRTPPTRWRPFFDDGRHDFSVFDDQDEEGDVASAAASTSRGACAGMAFRGITSWKKPDEPRMPPITHATNRVLDGCSGLLCDTCASETIRVHYADATIPRDSVFLARNWSHASFASVEKELGAADAHRVTVLPSLDGKKKYVVILPYSRTFATDSFMLAAKLAIAGKLVEVSTGAIPSDRAAIDTKPRIPGVRYEPWSPARARFAYVYLQSELELCRQARLERARTGVSVAGARYTPLPRLAVDDDGEVPRPRGVHVRNMAYSWARAGAAASAPRRVFVPMAGIDLDAEAASGAGGAAASSSSAAASAPARSAAKRSGEEAHDDDEDAIVEIEKPGLKRPRRDGEGDTGASKDDAK